MWISYQASYPFLDIIFQDIFTDTSHLGLCVIFFNSTQTSFMSSFS